MNVIPFKNNDNKRYKRMPDYKQGKIYAIRSHQTDQIYIGSTAQPLYKRLYAHKIDYKRWMNGKHYYVSSFEIVKYDDIYIELIENYPCENVEQLRKREGELIRQIDCVNKRVAGRTNKEYYEENKEYLTQKIKEYIELNKENVSQRQKNWYKENKDYVSQRGKEHYKRNKERIAKKHKEYYEQNRETFLEKNKIRCSTIIQCKCGKVFRKDNISKHLKSQIHYDNMLGLSVFGI